MSISVVEYLRHMMDEALFLEDSCRGVKEEEFLKNPVLLRACARAIEIIGEAAKKVRMISGSEILKSSGGRWPVCGTA